MQNSFELFKKNGDEFMSTALNCKRNTKYAIDVMREEEHEHEEEKKELFQLNS